MLKEGWVAIGLQLAGTLVIIGSCYAAAYTRITNLEDRMKTSMSDHDMLIALNTKMDGVLEEIKLLRVEFKSIKK